MKKTLIILSLFSGVVFANTMDNESNIKPVSKIYNLKCDKNLDGVVIKNKNNSVPPMVCNVKTGNWEKFNIKDSSEFKSKEICFNHFKEERKTNQAELESAINANDQNKVGEIVIKMHNDNKDFFAKNPQCKFDKDK